MGIVVFGIPKKISIFLRDSFGIKNLVETGAYYGGTTLWAAENFNNVYTVENSEKMYLRVKATLKNIYHVKLHFGNSPIFLKKIESLLAEPTVFWLDAHWSGGDTYGENDECPLIEEIKIINKYRIETFILIDDARMFLAPPALPHNAKRWPDINSLFKELGDKKYTVILDDVIISIPIKYRDRFISFLQDKYYSYLVKENKANNNNIIKETKEYLYFLATKLLLRFKKTS